MFRKKPAVVSTAREALRDLRFPCATGEVVVDDDPSVWTRLPQPGEDPTTWSSRCSGAWAADLAVPEGDVAAVFEAVAALPPAQPHR